MEFISDSGPKKPVQTPPGGTVKRAFLHTCAFIALAVPTQAFANPEGGIVTGGSATITENGSTLTIDQSTSRAIIDWRSFNIDPNETTRFNQPSSTSVTLNRVRAADPSYILGTLSANGTVILVNPSGVFFGANAVVDVAGMVATTADIRNENFMAGNYNFDIPGNPNARIVNQGLITAHDAGLVGLVAPNVENSGIISARLGKVSLASGDTFTLDMYGDNLINVAVSDDVAQQIVSNTGTIEAAGGTISMTAAAGRNVVNSLIMVAGELKAPTAGVKNGKIVIGAAGSNAVKNNIAADKGKKSGYSTVAISAYLDTSGYLAGQTGGSIEITADNIGLLSGTLLDASGDVGGGDIKIGGDYLGTGTTSASLYTYVDQNALILNTAVTNGNGGRTIVWSDGNTDFYGGIFARGGLQGGNGGFVETSGHNHLTAQGFVDLTAPKGEKGTYLLDPTNLAIYGNVDPNYVSTDGTSINLAASLKLWLDSSDTSKVVLTYNDTLTTATGTNGTNTITVGSSTDLVVGARIRLGGAGSAAVASTLGADTYTISAISGTTITLSTNLSTDYSGSAVYQGHVSQLTDKGPNSKNATTATPANMPVWISNGQNGLGVTRFNGSNQLDVTGVDMGTLFLSGLRQAHSSALWFQTSNTGANERGYGILLGAGAGFNLAESDYLNGVLVRQTLNNNNYTGGTNNTDVLSQTYNTPLIFSGYDSDQATNVNFSLGYATPSFIRLVGTVNEIVDYSTILSTDARNLVEQYQSAKWGIALDPYSSTALSEAAEAMDATNGYSVFTTRYLERLSQTANVSLVATNDIKFDLKGDTLNLAGNRDLTLTAGHDILSASAGTINTNGTGSIAFNATHDISISNMTIAALGTGTVNMNAGNNITLTGTGYYASSPTLTATGTLTIDPGSGNTMSVGPSSGSTLNISTAMLNNFNAGSYVFGSATSDLVTINTTKNFADKSLTFISGGSINLAGSLTKTTGTGTANYILQANRNIYNSNNGGVSATNGKINLVLNSDRDQLTNEGGVVSLSGYALFNTNGGDITIGGGLDPTTGYATSTDANAGVYLYTNHTFTSGAGNILIRAKNVAASGSSVFGFYSGGMAMSTTSGSISIYGRSSSAGNEGYGVFMQNAGAQISTQSGAILLDGVGGSGSSGLGVRIRTSAGITSTGTGTVGDITLTGTSLAGGNSGVDTSGITLSTQDANVIIQSTNSSGGVNVGTVTTNGTGGKGSLTLIGNYAAVNGASTISGTFTARPYTDGTVMNVGTASGVLYLTGTTLSNITAGSYVFGSATTGALTFNTTKDFGDRDVSVIANGSITIAGTLAKAAGTGTSNILFRSNNAITASSATINATSGKINLTLNADYDQATVPGGRVILTSTSITTNGGNLTIGGGTDPTTMYASALGSTMGVHLNGAAINTGTGNISILGQGGTTAGNYGVYATTSSTITTTSGHVNIIGSAQAVSNSQGINLAGITITTGTGAINLTGIGTPGIGLVLWGGALNSTSGNINLTGNASTSDIYLNDVAFAVNAGSGDITFTGDDYTWAATPTFTTTGKVIFKPFTAGYSMAVGTTGSNVNISNTMLANVTAGTYVFGATNTGLLTVNTTKDFGDKNVTFISGTDINLAGTLTKATGSATVNYLLQANRNIYNSGNSGITTSSGKTNLTLNSDYDQSTVVGGNIALTSGTFSTNGGYLVLGGGNTPMTGYATAVSTAVGHGIFLNGTTINAAGGDITMHGQGSASASCNNNCWGITTTASSIQTSGTGSINIFGIGGGTTSTNSNQGVQLQNATTITTSAGNIYIQGDKIAGGLSTNIGLATYNGANLTTTSGDITLASSNAAIATYGTTASTVTSGRDIIIQGDSFSLNVTGDAVTATGTMTIKPYTTGASMAIGTTGSVLNLSSTTLGKITAGAYIFGSADTGVLTINTARDFADRNVSFISGTDINLSSTLTKATGTGTANYVLTAKGNIYNSNSAGITRSTGALNIVMNADSDANSDGAINLTSAALTTNGGYIVLGGGAGTIGGTNGILGDGDGTGADDTAAWGNATYNPGITLTTTNMTTSGGNVFIKGHGLDGGATANRGMLITGGTINTAAGNINLHGTAGSGSNKNQGIDTTTSAAFTTTDGTITITGIGNGTGGNSSGLYLHGGTNISATNNGNVNLYGTGKTSGGSGGDDGIILSNATITIKHGALLLHGTGGTSNGGSDGIDISSASVLSTGTGSLTLTGIAANATSNDLNVSGTTNMGGASHTGNIIFNTNKLALTALSLQTTGKLTIAPRTAATTVGIGPASGSVLNISDTHMAMFNAGSYELGAANSGLLTISTAYDFGDKSVSFISGTDINIAGNLTKATGMGTANYLLQSNGSIYNSSNAGISATTGKINLILNADYDQGTLLGGAIALTGGSFLSNGGDITLSGGSNTATGYAYGTSTYIRGILLDGATVDSGAGALIARGHGYDSGSASGIQLTNGGKLKSASTLTMNGVGGGSGTGTDSYGIHITSLNSTIQTSGSGLLSATGTGGNQAGSGGTNVGIVTNIANAFQATGNGAITLTGQGGTQGGGSAGNNYGVTIAGGIAANGGLITINGTGGGTTGFNNYGIFVSGNITNANGGIILNATGGGTGASNINSGLRMSGGTIDGGSGTITVNAIGGTGSSTTSFNVNGGAIGTGTTTGAINLIGDSYIWSVGTVATSGTATFSNRTAGKTISIGSTSGYDLNISNAMLDLFTAGTYTFGSMNSGNLVVNTSKDFVDRNLNFLSGTSITMVGNLTKATGTGTANYLMQSNNGFFTNSSVSIQPTTGKINITINSDYDQATVTGGRIGIGANSTIKSGGGNIIMGGGLNPLVGYATGIDAAGIISNTGTVIDAGTGNITMRGATTGSSSTQGVTLFSTAIKTISGNITLDGTTNSSGNAAHGIAINGSSGASGIETTSGLISVKSRNLNTGNTSNVGLVMWVDTYIRSLGSGSITLDLQSTGIDFHGNTGTVSTIGGAAMTGDITINASDANAWASGVAITTQGKLTWAAASGESLGIGNSATGTTGKLTEAQLNTMTAGTYQFGDANTSSLVVNTTKDFADKSVTFVSGNDINIAGTLTKATGAGTASYIFYANRDIYSSNSAAMTASSGAMNIVLNADRDANQDGAIRLSSSNVTTNGGYLVMGGGAGTLGGTNGILGDGDGTGADDIGAWGNNTYRPGAAIVGGLINTGAGNIYISGHGVNTAGADGNRGVVISAGGRLQTSSGIITLKGTGGNGDDSNAGIYLTGAGTGITSDTGAINLTGFGGSDGGTDSDQNNGVRLDGGAVVSSTGTTSSAATITIIGTSTNSDDYNDGVSLADANTKVTSVRGAITITGTGGSNGLAGSLSNNGVGIINGAAVESTGVAPISITGIGAYNGSDIYTSGTGTNTIGGTAATGNITMNANTADLTALSAQTTGIITIANRTADTTIAVGPTATATLNLTTAILNMLNGGSYVFGSNTSGAMTINTTRDFADKSVTFISGNDISLAGTLTKASGSGTASYLLQANRNISNTGSAGISATSGKINLTINSDADHATSAGGTLTLTDASLLANGGTITLNSNGNALALSGSTVIGGDMTLNSANAGISIAVLNGDTAGTRSLTINNGTDTFTTTGIIGGTQKLKDFTINADDVALGNDIYGEGVLSIAPTSNNRQVVINYTLGGGQLHLTAAEVGYLKDGWSQINIGKTSGSTAYMDIGATTWNDPVNFRGWYTRVRGNISGVGNATLSFIGSGTELNGSSTVSTQNRDITFGNGFSQYTANNTINSNGGNIIISSGISSNMVNGGTTSILSGNGNITIGNGTTSIAAGAMTSGTYALNAGTGTLTFNGAVNTPVALTATAGSLVFNGAWGTVTPLGAVSLTSGTSVTLPTIRAATVFVQTTGAGANITIPVTRSLTTTGSGDAITLVAKNNFINQSATPFVMSNGGRYLVYSTNTTDTQLNGLASSFVRYSCTYGGTCPTFASETGNGLLYTFTPVLTVTPSAVAAITYGSAAPNLAGYTYGLSGWLSGADQSASIVTGTLNGATNYTQGANVGSYAVNYSAGTLAETLGYGFTYANNATGLTVNTRLLTVSLAGSVDRIYDGTTTATLASGNYTFGNIYNGESLGISNTSGTYSDKNVGTGKAVTVNGLALTGTTAGNYTLASTTVTGNVGNITKRDISVGGIGIAGKTYDGNDVASITGTAALSNTILNDDILLGGTASAHFINANAGISKSVTIGGYTVSGNDAGNYNFAQPTGLVATIAKKDVTITAANQSIVYGDTLPGTTLSYNGFISGEDHNVLDAAPSIASAQSGLVNAGTYSGNYTVSGGSDNNYSFDYIGGNLVVTKKLLTVTTGNQTVTYGTTVPTGTLTYNGFITGDHAGMLDTAPTISSVRSGIVDVGTYNGNYSVGDGVDNNYSFAYVGGNLAVTKKNLVATANSYSLPYGNAVPTGQIIYSGFENGESEGVLDTAPVLASAHNGVMDPGNYYGNYTVGGGVDNNYSFTYVAGNFTVTGEIPPPTIPSTTETGRLPQNRETIIDLGYQPVVTTNIQDTTNTFISVDPGFATTLGLDCGLAGVSCGTPASSEDQDDLSSADLDTISWN